MALEDLLASLAGEAEEERDAILARGAAEAARILEEARLEAEHRRSGPAREKTRRAGALRSRLLHQRRQEAREAVRTVQRELLASLEGEVLRQAAAFVREGAFDVVLRLLILEAIRDLEGGAVRTSPDQMGAARRAMAGVPAGFVLEADPSLAGPGVLVVAGDGLVEVDNTLPVRLRRYLDAHQAEVASLLLGAGPEGEPGDDG
jgi:vacuolar-type H+-ATPase subunit E/Vma4